MNGISLMGTITSVFLILSECISPAAGTGIRYGHVPVAVARLRPLQPLSGSMRLDLAIGLPLRNQEELNGLLEQIYDPASTNYHRYLTPEEFTSRFGPTEQDYQAVVAFANKNGLVVTGLHANRTLLNVNGSVAVIERAFKATIGLYQHPKETRTFYAPESELSLDLGVPVLHISGLDNYTLPHPMFVRSSPPDTSANAIPNAGSGPNGTFIGADFRAVYAPGVSLTGSGQAVGLFELDGYFPSDITAYINQAGLPNVPLQNVLIDGFDGIPSSRRPGSGNEEVALDIEMAISMAPGLSRVLVYEGAPTANLATINNILNRMATDNLAKQLSCSWGFDIDVNTQQIFEQFAAQGQSFFLASGDNGAFAGPVVQPSDNPYITVVGGTALTTDASGSWVSETTWNGSSGGISTLFPIPVWQQGIDMSLNQGSTTMRNLPDVAMVASNVWVIADEGRPSSVEGTSIATPLWAGFAALVNQQAAENGLPPVGFLNPTLYRIGMGSNYADTFHDITTGNNTSKQSPDLFHAAPGYDLCSGWGTPRGSNLINAIFGPAPDPLLITPPFGFTANGSINGPFNVAAQTYNLTNAGTTVLNWTLANTSPWLDVAPTSGTLTPGGPAAIVTASLNSAASNLLIGNFTANVSFANTDSGTAQNRQFKLLVGNGGFETGDFTDWTFSGDSQVNFADSIDMSQITGSETIPGIDDGMFVHSGIYGAFLGQSLTLGSLSKNVPTVSGQRYVLSIWLDNPAIGTPNEFRASWNGTTLFDQVDMGQFTWTNLQFIVTASASSTPLEFDFRNDQNAIGLDDISLSTVPAPTFWTITQTNGTITFAWRSMAGLTYQVQYTTNLNSVVWTDLGDPVAATGNTAIASDAIGPNPQRMYRVILLP
ncbi:MAG: protease pro-enzyme activation domain-containing protein [Candidatus Omnitrophica bacterium]|nr:protease pro-enzyme activation domain-containing protein [Candidatus Omnitrophota bacterium]